MLPATGCALRLSVENGFSHKVQVWLAVWADGQRHAGGEISRRCGSPSRRSFPDDLDRGHQREPVSPAVVSDRPDFELRRKWFENIVGTPTGPCRSQCRHFLADGGIQGVDARQPGEGDFKWLTVMSRLSCGQGEHARRGVDHQASVAEIERACLHPVFGRGGHRRSPRSPVQRCRRTS